MKDIKEIEEKLGVYKKLLYDEVQANRLLLPKDKHRKESEHSIERLKSIVEILVWILK